jgi:hypothetical protein
MGKIALPVIHLGSYKYFRSLLKWVAFISNSPRFRADLKN